MDAESAQKTWDAIFDWGGWDVVGLAAAVIISLVTYQQSARYRGEDRLRADLDRKVDRAYWRERLTQRGDPALRYADAIGRFNGWLDRWFLAGLFGRRAFFVCASLALVYPPVLFLLTWCLGGEPKVAGGPLFDPGIPPGAERWARGTSLIVIFGAFAWFLRLVGRVGNPVREWLIARLIARLGEVGGALMYGVLLTVAFFLTGSVAMTIATYSTVALAFAFTLVIASTVVGVAFGNVFGADPFVSGYLSGFIQSCVLTSLLIIGFWIILGFDIPDKVVLFAGAIFLFWISLPYANAAFDWLSWGFTRWFLRRAQQAGSDRRWLILAADLIADFAVAVACLFGLAALLPNIIEVYNRLIPVKGVIDWRAMLETAQAEPWRDGFMVTGMLLTTMAPTALHLIAGLSGVFSGFSPPRHEAAAQLDRWEDLPGPERDHVVRVIRREGFWTIPAAVIVLIFFAALAAIPWLWGRTLGDMLGSTALWATAWAQ